MPAVASGRRGRRGEINYWPGFVDALSTLLLAIIFLISVFMLGQFFLARELSSRDTVLDRLNRQIAELTDLLALERSGRRELEQTVTGLQSTLQAAEAERSRLQGVIASGSGAQDRAAELNAALESERQATGRAIN
ncbi:MAG: peptidoglycan-binding protein, partial [Pseudomonadota bacterium]|nr:peptidoglycan-binding protein [Pseudomonadota bacterium]